MSLATCGKCRSRYQLRFIFIVIENEIPNLSYHLAMSPVNMKEYSQGLLTSYHKFPNFFYVKYTELVMNVIVQEERVMKNLSLKLAAFVALLAVTIACEKNDRSFSVLAVSQSYDSGVAFTPKPIDVLWIIDDSGSMQSSQDNLVANFQSFITKFQTKNYDFHMGVQSTGAWRALFPSNFTNAAQYGKLKDGKSTDRSGIFVMDKNTPNLSDVFVKNASLGINGTGDERAFQSIEATLLSTLNPGFRRPEAYLAVIILSDEDDFSRTRSGSGGDNYNDQYLRPVSYFKNFLDSQVGVGNYSVNTISILDQQCLNQLLINAQKISTRYIALADQTGGAKVSLCGNFGTGLDFIAGSIIAANSVFKLARTPIESTIRVKINGAVVPQDATNGWTYDSTENSVTLHGSSIPDGDDQIIIDYDPVDLSGG